MTGRGQGMEGPRRQTAGRVICRGGSGDDAGRGPLWPPAWPTARAIPDTTIDHAGTGVRRATIKAHPAPLHHPRPYGILDARLRLMPIWHPLPVPCAFALR